MEISIIIVNYKSEKELLNCISSIKASGSKLRYEIIVVDNNSTSKFEIILKNKYSEVKYIKSPKNLGYGYGNNLGARSASGKYLFFLNPDTKILKGTLDNLHSFLIKNSATGIVSPLITDDKIVPFKFQGSRELNLKTIIFSQSVLRKIFPGKNIYENYKLNIFDESNPTSVDAVPGAAMMINSDLFKKIGGFDEKFFLYFEENDISKRLSNLGYKLFIIPSAKIIHFVGRSTKNLKSIENIYAKSRYLYMKKHYGMLQAMLVNAVLSVNKYSIALFAILISGLILRIINLWQTMPFIGDQAWFYLSARGMVLDGQIPLVGIASSHPWLHQGPLWTYILALILWIFKFNPLAPGYFIVIMGIVTVFLTYKIGSIIFSKRIGIVASFLSATSPLIILNDRMPYHTTLIPLFVLLLIYSIYRWTKGSSHYFPLSIFLLAVLYNLEIETVLLWLVLAAILVYGVLRRTDWETRIANKRVMFLSSIGVVIPMIPMLIYDIGHGFPQTVKFGLWIGYRIASIFGFPAIHSIRETSGSVSLMPFTLQELQKLVFLPNLFLTSILLLGSLLVTIYLICSQYLKKKDNSSHIIISLILIISVVGYVGTGVASNAYFPLIFPPVIFILAVGFDYLLNLKYLYIFGIIIILLVGFFNGYIYLEQNNFKKENNVHAISNEISIAQEIIQKTHGRRYNILGRGPSSEFESFTMSYQYLTWWLGHGPSNKNERLKIYISELFGETKIEAKLVNEK